MFKKYLLLFFSVCFLFVTCKEEDSPSDNSGGNGNGGDNTEEVEPVIDSFKINDQLFTISSGVIEGYIHTPKNIDVTTLAATFYTNNTESVVKVGDVAQESGITENDFSKPVTYTVYSESGQKSKDYVVKLTVFTRLPRLFITTENGVGINSKDNYINATFRLEPNQQYNCDVLETTGRIKGRGNSTWDMIKKPYKIKFDKATGVLGMAPYKEWTLLANYADKSLMRNYLAYELSSLLDMPFAPARNFVEVFLNGKHVGNYMLSDQIEIGSTRVNVSKIRASEVNDGEAFGGYLLEIDYRSKEEEDAIWFESYGMPVALKDPDEFPQDQLDCITSYVNKADKALKDYADGYKNINYQQYFDDESTIKWFLVNEFFKNSDASGYSSIFFYKNRNDKKLYMGPVWDFDIAAGNARHVLGTEDPTGWWVRSQPRIDRMYTDPEFQKRVKEIWKQYKPQFKHIIDEVDVMAEKLDLSQKENFELWPDFQDPNYFVIPGNLTYEAQITYLKSFLQTRYNWLDAQFQ